MNTNEHKLLNKITSFLKSYSMNFEDIDMEICCEDFLAQMQAGLSGQNSSLAMIPTYIEIQTELPKNKPVIVIDAGGTNFRSAVVYFDENAKPIIKKLHKKTMPGIEKEVSKDEFFDTLAGYIKDISKESDRIGFCFSYPCEITPDKDGKLLLFSKEIKAPQVIGQMIGKNLNDAINRIGSAAVEHHIVILNDTVTTLLAAMAGFENKNYESYVGFILGTGTNTCYIEKNGNIGKVKNLDPQKHQIINIESGGFNKARRGKIDIDFDNSTNNPGVNIFEKMVSGAYMGPLCLKVIQTAVDDKLFSSQAAENLSLIKSLSTKQLSDFLTEPTAPFHPLGKAIFESGNYDKNLLYLLAETLVERAAKLTAVNLAAVVIKSNKGKNPEKPVCIVAEGTTFYSLAGLKEKTERYLKDFLVKQKGFNYEITHIENATLIGAAIAGLTN
ncbi:MAG: hexokinase [Phycisphaerae bacterium]